ncbi:hypothetical protein AVEN_109387-1 [Araneus ventricosus]|uniref:Uncharacterized protein n=1 Tax=Araneus ventricosus TaxID=182803 RepID=A0A4Y2WQN4_ARAVE|nr:hypothetical protein AVEN_109387-1 [Araneus ventricosus]
MILHGAAAWAYPLSARQSRLWVQFRKVSAQHHRAYSLLNSRTTGYRGIIPLHQSRTGSGLRQNNELHQASSTTISTSNPNNYEDGTTSTNSTPANFQEDRISLKKQFPPVPGLNIFWTVQR